MMDALDACWRDQNIAKGIVLLEMLRVMSDWDVYIRVRKV
jgi:hypothetical protein